MKLPLSAMLTFAAGVHSSGHAGTDGDIWEEVRGYISYNQAKQYPRPRTLELVLSVGTDPGAKEVGLGSPSYICVDPSGKKA